MDRRFPVSALVVILSIAAAGCKAKVAESRTQSAMSLPNSSLLFADAQGNLESISDFYYLLFKSDMRRNLSESEALRSGSVEATRIPYSDGWFPESKGGTNALGANNNSVGALTKYDQAFNGGAPKAVDWENTNHAEIVSWYGHCNGFSTAASRHQNPGKSVRRPVGCSGNACVDFAPHHIRALLAEVYMSAKSRFLGGDRCRTPKTQLSEAPQDRADPLVMDACDDVDPGEFHLALINFIGVQKQVVIYDQARDEQVWNFPLYKYQYTLEDNGKRLTRAQAAAEMGRAGATDYAFNPNAVSFVKVSMTVYHAAALFEAPNTAAVPTQEVAKNYRYLLELDANGNILGGEWLGVSRADHPDFIWFPFEPFENDGNRKYGNPHVKTNEVVGMWAESMGFNIKDPFSDPKNPNHILQAPESAIVWGTHENFFDASIDGAKTGAIFLGKKTHLKVNRLGKLQGEVGLELLLNGESLVTLRASGSAPLEYEFDSPLGINTLDFRWTLDGQAPPGANVSFRYYAMR